MTLQTFHFSRLHYESRMTNPFFIRMIIACDSVNDVRCSYANACEHKQKANTRDCGLKSCLWWRRLGNLRLFGICFHFWVAASWSDGVNWLWFLNFPKNSQLGDFLNCSGVFMSKGWISGGFRSLIRFNYLGLKLNQMLFFFCLKTPTCALKNMFFNTFKKLSFHAALKNHFQHRQILPFAMILGLAGFYSFISCLQRNSISLWYFFGLFAIRSTQSISLNAHIDTNAGLLGERGFMFHV